MKSPTSKQSSHSSYNKSKKMPTTRSIALVTVVFSAALIFGSRGTIFQRSVLVTKAQSVSVDDKQVSPEALQQIAAMIQEKESRTAAQKKIDSRLLYKIRMERGEPIANGVPGLRTDLTVDNRGFIEVEIIAHVGKRLLAALRDID